jgi:hypothetical protein
MSWVFGVGGQDERDGHAGGGEDSEEEGEGGDEPAQEGAGFVGLPALIAFDERRQERGGEGAFAEQSPEEVGGAERDGERVPGGGGAEVSRAEHVAHEPEDARQQRARADDAGRADERAFPQSLSRRVVLLECGSIGS